MPPVMYEQLPPEDSGYSDYGTIELNECDDMNVPVNISILEPDESSEDWVLMADNFTPRKGKIEEGAYIVHASDRKTLFDAVQQYVTPLYETAVKNLKANGQLYYWEEQQRD